jgi:orotate phosphoribosyltransferase
VAAVICLVDREEGGAAKLAAYPFYSIFKRSEIFE